MSEKPPLGVMPENLWRETHPDPSLTELIGRRDDVKAAIERYRRAELKQPVAWHYEVLQLEKQIRRKLEEPQDKE